MTTVHTLASGSSGNALLLSFGSTHILLDAGISCRRIVTSLQSLGLKAPDISGIFITHTHTDHIAGLQTLLKKCPAPIYATPGAMGSLLSKVPGTTERACSLPVMEPLRIGAVSITSFPTSHDAPGSCGYRIDTADGSIGLLTDSGFVTEAAADILPGVDLAFLEANHDVEALCSGPYPYYLKERILGQTGHLCNEDAGRFAVVLAEAGASEIVLAHLSRENNTPAMALRAVSTALSAAGLAPALSAAPRDSLSHPYCVSRRVACKK